MSKNTGRAAAWLDSWMERHNIKLWGFADLQDFDTPVDENDQIFPFAIAWVIPMNPQIMGSIKKGPNKAYAEEYTRVNGLINQLARDLTEQIRSRGVRAQALAASVRSDPIGIKGDFPHKTAATRAGLGWVGRNCQLVTRSYGPWVRLGTVFTDLDFPSAKPIEKSYCGTCKACVEACPGDALLDGTWYPGISRNEILDAAACDRWKKANYFEFHKGHNCGICSAVCPHGLKILER